MSSYRAGNQAGLAERETWWDNGLSGQEYQPPRQKRPGRRAQNLPPQTRMRSSRSRQKRRKEQMLSRALMYATLSLLAVCLFLQVSRYAAIAGRTRHINTLHALIKEADSDRTNLELRLSAREDLQRIREAAFAMGMDYPAEGQVRVVALNGSTAQ